MLFNRKPRFTMLPGKERGHNTNSSFNPIGITGGGLESRVPRPPSNFGPVQQPTPQPVSPSVPTSFPTSQPTSTMQGFNQQGFNPIGFNPTPSMGVTTGFTGFGQQSGMSPASRNTPVGIGGGMNDDFHFQGPGNIPNFNIPIATAKNEPTVDVGSSFNSDIPDPVVDSGRADFLINKYLDSSFGDEQSFDPIADLMGAERDRALRRYSEQMGSRGMVGSGVEGGAQDLLATHARNLAGQAQQFEQQQVNNQMNAASMLMQDQWKNLDNNQQAAMAKMMYDLNRGMQFGEGSNKSMGTVDAQALMQLMAADDLDPFGKEMLEGLMERYFGLDMVRNWKYKSQG